MTGTGERVERLERLSAEGDEQATLDLFREYVRQNKPLETILVAARAYFSAGPAEDPLRRVAYALEVATDGRGGTLTHLELRHPHPFPMMWYCDGLDGWAAQLKTLDAHDIDNLLRLAVSRCFRAVIASNCGRLALAAWRYGEFGVHNGLAFKMLFDRIVLYVNTPALVKQFDEGTEWRALFSRVCGAIVPFALPPAGVQAVDELVEFVVKMNDVIDRRPYTGARDAGQDIERASAKYHQLKMQIEDALARMCSLVNPLDAMAPDHPHAAVMGLVLLSPEHTAEVRRAEQRAQMLDLKLALLGPIPRPEPIENPLAEPPSRLVEHPVPHIIITPTEPA